MADSQDRPDSEPDDASTPPAKKPPAKKAAKAPAKNSKPEPPPITEDPVILQQQIETNGQLVAAAKDTAAQAKSTVEATRDPVPRGPLVPAPIHSPLPLAAAVALSLLALLLVRQLRRR